MPSTVGYPKEISEVGAEKAADRVRLYQELLEHGRMYRRDRRENKWKRSEEQYEGKHWNNLEDDPNMDRVTVNISYSTVNTIVPYVTGEEPNFLVEPYSGNATARKARIQQALLNRVWRSSEVKGQDHLEDAAVDMLIYGDGYLQVGYEITEKRLDEGSYAEVASILIDRLDPWDVWIDPLSDGVHNARWVCRRILTTWGELNDDERYTVPADLEPSIGHQFSREDDRLRERMYTEVHDRDRAWVEMYEFYDLVDGVAVTFSVDSFMPLRWVEDPSLPIVQYANYRIPKSPYHMGELEQLRDLQMELNYARSQMATHRRRNAQKIVYKEDALDTNAIAALQSQEVNAGVPVKGDLELDQLVKPLEVPNLTADVYNISDIITRDVYEISGVNEYLRGATPEIRRTATEATIIEGASNVKSRYKLRLIEKGTREVGQLMLGSMADVYPITDFEEESMFLTGSDAEAIANLEFGENMGVMMEEGANDQDLTAFAEKNDPSLYGDVSVTPGADLFDGDYEVFVESHSTELRNPVLKEQKAREMFLVLSQQAPMLQQMGVSINLRKLLERWFEAAGVSDIEGMFEAADPLAGLVEQLGSGAGPGQAQAGQPPAQGPLAALQGMGAMTDQNTGAMPAEPA